MSSIRFVGFVVSLSLLACEESGGGDEGSAGQLGQPCIGGSFCNDGLVCSAGVCMAGDDEAGESDVDSSGSESGDGDSSDTSTTGTPTPEFDLYEGACANSDECIGDLWCTDEGRSWCAMDCTSDADCPAHASATAVPRCEYLDEIAGSGPRQGCLLECVDESECPVGAQCFYSGLASKNWCGFLP